MKECKHCSKCDTTKSVAEFGPNKARKDGLAVYCRTCNKSYLKEKQYDKIRWEQNREFESGRSLAYRTKNREALRAKYRERMAILRVENPASIKANNIRRKYSQKQATPTWADMTMMNLIYKTARDLEAVDGVKLHVDHIVPLKHNLVCGLHVHHNLSIVTATENMQKHNKFTV